MKVLVNLDPGESSPPGFYMATFVLCPLMAEREQALVSLPLRVLAPPSWI